MTLSIYDFDTRFAPFEALAGQAPFAPFALWGWFAAPALWCTDALLNTCGMYCEAMLSAMTCPYGMPAGRSEGLGSAGAAPKARARSGA
jgi:hypothetical protein